MSESTSDIENQGSDAVNKDLEMEIIPVTAFPPALEAELRLLVHNICSPDIKQYSDAPQEFSNLLKGETGSDLMRLYFNLSPDFVELFRAWELRHSGKLGLSCIFSLIETILSHPEGGSNSTDIGSAIDEFCKLLISKKNDDIYTVLNSNEGEQQNAALSLLTSIVRRGPHMAKVLADNLNFNSSTKLGKVTRTRKRFVAFALSFLEAGKPRCLRMKMYSTVIQGLGNDDDETLAFILSTLKNKFLVLDESKVSRRLRRTVFDDLALEKLANITGREGDGVVSELAYDVLVKVCTDPSNGLMPDATGNPRRLLKLMKKLRPRDSYYHFDLLVAIVRGRPFIASAFFDEFPYNVEDLASPSWSSSMSLAENLVSSARTTCSFDFLNPDRRATAGSDVQTIMKCVCPRPFRRSLINKGLQHGDSLVKEGTLRFLSEALRLWDSFVTAWKLCSSHSCSGVKIHASLERDIMCEARSFFPDPQLLLNTLNSLWDYSGTEKEDGDRKKTAENISLKRKADSGSVSRKKKFKTADKDDDIMMNVVGSNKDIFSEDAQMTNQVDTQMADQADAEKLALLVNLLDALRIYMHSGLDGLEGSFNAFMKKLPSSASGLPAELQRALLSLLQEYVIWTPKLQNERVPTRIPPLMFKQFDVFLNLLLFSSDDEVKDLAKKLAVVAMSSTGAFDKNPSEIGGWFIFLPVDQNLNAPLKAREDVERTSSVVISFICDAVSTVGNQLFKQWDKVKSICSHLEGVSIKFSPLIGCILQKCGSLLNPESGESKFSLEEKTAISLYVCSTLKSLLQTQVDSKPLSWLVSCLVQSVLSEKVSGSKDSCEWWPLRMLLLFSQSLSDNKPFILPSANTTADTYFANTLDKIERQMISISSDGTPRDVKVFPSPDETPELILKNFVLWAFYGASISYLHSIAFLEETFLGNLLKLSPDLFVQASELTVPKHFLEGETIDREIESSVFFMFLEKAPFPVLLNVVMMTDISCLSELLLLKVVQPKSNSIELHINSILFWLSQIRSAYKVQPAPVLCQRSVICLSIMNRLFSQISEQDLVSGPSSDKLLVAQTVLCHQVVMALVERPLDCGTLPPVQNLEIVSETLLISEIDQHILNILASTCEHFLFDERQGDVKANQSIVAFNKLVNKLLLVFSDKFEQCVGSQDYAPLLQPARLIHDLLRFISPAKLLYLARSMLKKIDEVEFGSLFWRTVFSLGFDIAGGAFEVLISYSHQPASKRGVYDLLWEEEENYDGKLIEEVYSLACRFSTSFGLVSADTCLLKVVGGIFKGKYNRHCSLLPPLTLTISRIVGRTPKELIFHCINQASMTRAKVLFYLVESSPLHPSIFGHHFFSKQQDHHSALTDDQFIMLLPAVMSYLASVSAKLEKPCLDTTIYSTILVNGFFQWPDFSSRAIFEEKYEEILLSTTGDIDTLFDASLLGKAVRMFQYHLTDSPNRTNDLLKVLYSMFPQTSADIEIKEVDVRPVDHMLNVAIHEVAKVELARICLFPEDMNATSPEIGSNREILLNRVLNAFVNTWECVVKLSVDSFKQISEEEQGKCLFLCKSLENFILRSILNFLEDACEELIHLDSLPFLERLMDSVLQYRFEDSKTWKILTEIFSVLSRGKYSYAPYIQLIYPQLPKSFSSLSTCSSHTVELSSILKHLIISSPNSVGVEAPDNAVQLEIVKTLRVLFSKCGKESGINLKDLHFILFSSYGATLSEIDLEIDKLMHDIELIDEESILNVSETDCLWGKAALKIREGLRCSRDGGEDLQQRLFKDNLCVDPKICARTILYFPYQHSTEVSDNSYDPTSEKCERYDPAFILRFSLHSLSIGYIEPVEFVSLGLLAVAFVSMSSADLGMRKLGYATLGEFVKALKCCQMKKDGLTLLLSYVQNRVNEPWQRISSVFAVFAAETSLILLNSSRKHYKPIINFLEKSDLSKPEKEIPLFPDFFDSSVVEQRLWVLRLLYAGLKSEDDAQMYIRNSVLERLMSFTSTPLADAETKRLVLEVVRKSVKFHDMAQHLVRNCGLLSWCSSFMSVFTTKPLSGDVESRFVVVLEIISNALASTNVSEWLERFAFEELMGISSRLYRVLGGGLVSVGENNTSVDLILQILYATLKISQNREIFTPHFTITMEGIFQLFVSVDVYDSPQVKAIAERALDTILMSTPPVGIIHMDVDKLRRFLLWGTSTALRIDSKQDTWEVQEETMVTKFLRWLLASVILGKLYYEANEVLSETKPKTLLDHLKKRNLKGSMTKSEHVIGEVIMYLQKLVCRALLPSVVFALALMLPKESSSDRIQSLCSRIGSPPEAIPDWRWSYDAAWEDILSEPATDLEKVDRLHVCQDLLHRFSDMLGETPQDSQLDMSGVFEWERGLVIET